MAGWLLQWPTIPTVVMFPILAVVYARLARSEEHEVEALFGPQWSAYANHVHRYLPHRPPDQRPGPPAGEGPPGPSGRRPIMGVRSRSVLVVKAMNNKNT
jgi:hypothetical protein